MMLLSGSSLKLRYYEHFESLVIASFESCSGELIRPGYAGDIES